MISVVSTAVAVLAYSVALDPIHARVAARQHVAAARPRALVGLQVAPRQHQLLLARIQGELAALAHAGDRDHPFLARLELRRRNLYQLVALAAVELGQFLQRE